MNKTIVRTSLSELSPLITDCLEKDMEIIITVTGNSMQPLLAHNRDQAVLMKADKQNLKKGDVPLYIRKNGQYVFHRIVRRTQGTYTMMGDAQTVREYGIRPEQIVAVAKGFYRNGQYIDCQSKVYRFYAAIWIAIWPLHCFLLWVKEQWEGILHAKQLHSK